jgi:NTE family protein
LGFTHIIKYNDGITSDQVIASASVPVNFGYATLAVESYNKATSNYEKNIRYFWDGGIMSNTPLKQVVQLHRQYWVKIKGFKDTVPRLNIFIVNVHPLKQDTIPQDHDGVINRNNDITFSDRTDSDQQSILIVSDLVDLAVSILSDSMYHVTHRTEKFTASYHPYIYLCPVLFCLTRFTKEWLCSFGY